MKQIGRLSNSTCERLLSTSTFSNSTQLMLDEIESIIKIKSFARKAKVKSVISRDSLSIRISEEKTLAKFYEKSSPGNKYKFSTEFGSHLRMNDIWKFQKFNRFYVLPYSVETHVCPQEESCPDCTDGKCSVCKGEKKVICDACNGDKKCSSCDGSGEYPCKSCSSSGICRACDGTGKYPCQACDDSGVCQSCEGSGRYPCYSCNETGECRHCGGSGKEDCDDCDGDGWVWGDCGACNGTGQYMLRNGKYVKCRVCHGSGSLKEDCWTCGGSGSVACYVCDGSGQCDKCGGEGDVECRTCDGKGECPKCKGKGYITCRICNGSYICAACKGTGYVRCRACHGNGVCGKCKGTGTLGCLNCNITGICPTCNGTKHVTCHICKGTGMYQTFLCIDFDKDSYIHLLNDESIENLIEHQLGIDPQTISKRSVYQGTPYIGDFGKPVIDDYSLLDYLNRFSTPLFYEKMTAYRDKLLEPDGPILKGYNVYVNTSIPVEWFPIIGLGIEYSNEIFIFYIIGNDGKVFADKIPSWRDRICANFF